MRCNLHLVNWAENWNLPLTLLQNWNLPTTLTVILKRPNAFPNMNELFEVQIKNEIDDKTTK